VRGAPSMWRGRRSFLYFIKTRKGGWSDKITTTVKITTVMNHHYADVGLIPIYRSESLSHCSLLISADDLLVRRSIQITVAHIYS
jgi:hypothetical protein